MNLEAFRDEIKAIASDCKGTPTAKLCAILAAVGIDKAKDQAAILGITERAIRKAKTEPQDRNHSSERNLSSGTTVPKRNHSSEKGTTVPEPEFRSSCAPIHARLETPSGLDSNLDISNTPQPPKVPNGPTPTEALQAFTAYNETALRCGLPQAARCTPDRQRKIIARLRDYGLDGWNRALANIEKSAFLTGGTDHGFRADLDFVCQAKSFGKLHDGGYGNGRHADKAATMSAFKITPKPLPSDDTAQDAAIQARVKAMVDAACAGVTP